MRISRKLMGAITGPNPIEKNCASNHQKHYKKGKVCNGYKRMKIETTALGDTKATAYRSG